MPHPPTTRTALLLRLHDYKNNSWYHKTRGLHEVRCDPSYATFQGTILVHVNMNKTLIAVDKHVSSKMDKNLVCDSAVFNGDKEVVSQISTCVVQT